MIEENYKGPDLPSEEDVLKEYRGLIEDKNLVAHDVEKDIRELNQRFKAYGIKELNSMKSDTKQIFNSFEKSEKSKLEYVSECLQLGTFQSHHAYEDAMMHAKAYEWMMHHRELKE